MPKKRLTGEIVSNKMQKTVVVKVVTLKKHPKYRKIHKVYKKYKADTGGNDYNLGDKVIIEESRPLSKEKRWKVIEHLK